MAMGADKGILVTDRVLGGADTWATSTTIAGALRNIEYDLIITGRQAIDGDTAQVGPQPAGTAAPFFPAADHRACATAAKSSRQPRAACARHSASAGNFLSSAAMRQATTVP